VEYGVLSLRGHRREYSGAEKQTAGYLSGDPGLVQANEKLAARMGDDQDDHERQQEMGDVNAA
jgi:hypothetical protein